MNSKLQISSPIVTGGGGDRTISFKEGVTK